MSGQESMITPFAQAGSDFQIQYVMVDGEPWFRGKEVAKLLGYANTTQAILSNVEGDDRKKLKEIVNLSHRLTDYHFGISVFVNESGLYSLILRSQKEEAKAFQQWVTKDVIPSIRKTGSHSVAPEQPSLPPAPEPSAISQLSFFDLEKIKVDNYINLYNEKELHIKVVQYIRRFHPDAVMMAGLGELQETV